MKRSLSQTRRAVLRPAAIALLLVMAALPVVQAATDATPATESKAAVAATPPARPASAPVSPHARAAQQRALAQADSAAQGIRVSPYTDRRKPHKPVVGR
jgi:hypothetical protein